MGDAIFFEENQQLPHMPQRRLLRRARRRRRLQGRKNHLHRLRFQLLPTLQRPSSPGNELRRHASSKAQRKPSSAVPLESFSQIGLKSQRKLSSPDFLLENMSSSRQKATTPTPLRASARLQLMAFTLPTS